MTHTSLKNGAVCASLLLSTFLVSPALAQEVLEVDPIIVEAPAMSLPGTASYPASDATSAQPYSDGGDYLRSLPGVSAGRFGGHGLELYIRGQSQGQLNVVNDNAYTFGACPNRMDPPSAYINILPRDTIEIVQGYQSVLNGFGGSGGSVIVTQNPPEFGEELSYEGLLQGGFESNSQMWNAGANVAAGTAQGYAKAYGSYKDSGNYDDGDGDEVRSSFKEKSGGLSFGYTPQGSHVYAGVDYHRIDDALFPGAGMDSPLAEGQTFKAGIEHDVNGPAVQNVSLSGYASLVDHVMDNYSLRPFTSAMALRVDSQSDTFGLKLKSDVNIAERPVEALLEWRRNNRNADRLSGMSVTNVNTLQSLLWPDITIAEAALAAETTYDLDLTTRLVAGGRYDLVHVDYGRANEAAPGAGGRSPNDIYTQFYGVTADEKTEHNLGGLLRLEHDLQDNVMLYAGLSRSVRTADATERGLANFMGAGGATSWVGNPDIAPEKHHQIDAGFDIQEQDWTFGSSVYANLVDDYILRDSARVQDGILVNFPNADIYRNVDALLAGFELHGQWQFAQDWRFEGDATFTYGEDIDTGRALPQIPPLQGKLGVNWQAMEHLEVGTTMRWALEQNRVDTDATTGTGRDVGTTDGYAVFDLGATLTEFEPVELSFGVTNLFDTTYASHLNRSNISDPTEVQVNEPGRGFYVNLRIPF